MVVPVMALSSLLRTEVDGLVLRHYLQGIKEDMLALLDLQRTGVLILTRHSLQELEEDAMLALFSLPGFEVLISLRRLLQVEETILALPHLQQIGPARLFQLIGAQLQGLLEFKASEVVATSFLTGPTLKWEIAKATRLLRTPAFLV